MCGGDGPAAMIAEYASRCRHSRHALLSHRKEHLPWKKKSEKADKLLLFPSCFRIRIRSVRRQLISTTDPDAPRRTGRR